MGGPDDDVEGSQIFSLCVIGLRSLHVDVELNCGSEQNMKPNLSSQI